MPTTYPVLTERTLASGAVALVRPDGSVEDILPADAFGYYEGPTCSICDAVGHGYPGGGPCPLEERGEEGVPWYAQ